MNSSRLVTERALASSSPPSAATMSSVQRLKLAWFSWGTPMISAKNMPGNRSAQAGVVRRVAVLQHAAFHELVHVLRPRSPAAGELLVVLEDVDHVGVGQR